VKHSTYMILNMDIPPLRHLMFNCIKKTSIGSQAQLFIPVICHIGLGFHPPTSEIDPYLIWNIQETTSIHPTVIHMHNKSDSGDTPIYIKPPFSLIRTMAKYKLKIFPYKNRNYVWSNSHYFTMYSVRKQLIQPTVW